MINKLNEHLLGKPSLHGERCCVCGRAAQNNHHVIIKGMGGSKVERDIPTVPLCGMGNTGGCHGLAHSGRLFLDYRDGGWKYLESTEPITLLEAMGREGWRDCIG